MLQLLKNYYNFYKSPSDFLIHKCTHFGTGYLVGLIAMYSLGFSMSVLVLAAVGKEIFDKIEAGTDDLPFYCHVFDVLITVLGGLAGWLTLYYLGYSIAL